MANFRKTVVLFAFCAISINLFAQKDSIKSIKDNYYYQGDSANFGIKPEKSPFILKSNPFAIIMSPIPIAAEYRICGEFSTKKKQAFQFGLSYLGKGIFIHIFDIYNQPGATPFSKQLQLYGGRVQFEYKYYFLPQYKGINGELLPYGMYIAPHFSVTYAELHSKVNKDEYYTFQNSNIVAMLGYNLDFGVGVNMDFFVGMGYKWNIWQEIDTVNNTTHTFSRSETGIYGINLKIYLGFNIGIAI